MVKKSSFYMTEKEKQFIDKWVFILLGANNNDPIKGRIRFTKEFFLIARKFVPKLYKVSEFYGYHFGPYSTRMALRINKLKKQGQIEANFVNQDWQYTLSETGFEIAKKFINSIPKELLIKIENLKKRNRNLKLKELLKEIYIDFPEFTKRSLIAKTIIKDKVNLKKLPQIDDGPGFVASISLESREMILKGKVAKSFLDLLSE